MLRSVQTRGFGPGVIVETPRVAGAYCAVSPHLIVTAFAGSPTIRIRRDSDLAELDFTPNDWGWVRSRDVIEWVGNLGWARCATLYDQTGNSRDFTPTTGRHPYVDCTGPYIRLRFDGDDSFLGCEVQSMQDFCRNENAFSMVAVRQQISATNGVAQGIIHCSIDTTVTEARAHLAVSSTGIVHARIQRPDAGTQTNTAGFAEDREWAVQVGRFDLANDIMYHRVNSQEETVAIGGSAGTSTSNLESERIEIGRGGSSSEDFDGYLTAAIFIQSVLSDGAEDTIVSDFSRLFLTVDDDGYDPLDVSVSAPTTIYTRAELDGKGLIQWPDGVIGVMGGGLYVAPDGTHSEVTSGDADDPAGTIVDSDSQITNQIGTFEYMAGGPVYVTSGGTKIMAYHAEIWPGGDPGLFYPNIGLARYTNPEWRDCGVIVSPDIAYDAGATANREMGAGAIVVFGGYMYCFYRETKDLPTSIFPIQMLCVARALLTDVEAAVAVNTVPVFHKYYLGTWTELGLGGSSTPLEVGNPNMRWVDVALHVPSQTLLAVITDSSAIWLIQSRNGTKWGRRRLLSSVGGEMFYPSLHGDEHREITGSTAYIYYTQSFIGEFGRWTDAELWRQTLTLTEV
jgi:hypothetical protein